MPTGSSISGRKAERTAAGSSLRALPSRWRGTRSLTQGRRCQDILPTGIGKGARWHSWGSSSVGRTLLSAAVAVDVVLISFELISLLILIKILTLILLLKCFGPKKR